MNLIEKYIEQVGEYLPARDREDIKKEIRSILEDTLENRSQEEGRPVDEAMTIDVLKEFGTPKKMAASYLPSRYLIGPRLFPTFLMVTKLILGIMLLVVIVTTAVSMSQQPYTIESAIEFLIKKSLDLLGSMLSVFGNVVFVFAIVEWALSKSKTENENTWDPHSLTGEDDTDEIKPLGQVPDIIFSLIALLIFNIFSRQLGMNIQDTGGESVFIPALSAVFYTYLPWLNGIWISGLLLNFALIRAGKWQPWSKWFQMALDVFSIVIFIVMAAGPSIITDAGEKLALMGTKGTEAAAAYLGLGIGMKALLIVLAVVTAVDLVTNVVKLIWKK